MCLRVSLTDPCWQARDRSVSFTRPASGMAASRSRPNKTKGELTREQVIAKAAALFNQLGYKGASISDIMRATGLQKGGIYRHFESKEVLELAAFEFAVEELGRRFQEALAGKATAGDRLRAIVGVYASLPTNPPVPGGCPVLNAAVEADDSNPALKRRVAKVLRDWHSFVTRVVSQGQARGELCSTLDPAEFTTALIAALEGAIMLSKLWNTSDPMREVRAEVEARIRDLERG
jgi:TetR/AcrR family transcriptional repressor of nem operon